MCLVKSACCYCTLLCLRATESLSQVKLMLCQLYLLISFYSDASRVITDYLCVNEYVQDNAVQCTVSISSGESSPNLSVCVHPFFFFFFLQQDTDTMTQKQKRQLKAEQYLIC